MHHPGDQLEMRRTRQIRPSHTASNHRIDATLQSKDHASNGRAIKQRRSIGVSGRHRATIAAPRSAGDLPKRARLMQFPRVVVATGCLDRSVVHELPENVDGCAVVGVPLRVGVAECVRVDLGSVER